MSSNRPKPSELVETMVMVRDANLRIAAALKDQQHNSSVAVNYHQATALADFANAVISAMWGNPALLNIYASMDS